MKKSTKIAFAATALVTVGAVSMTYAYWSQTSTFANPFNTLDYGTTAIEYFSPVDGEDWVPGVTVKKEVEATNTGDYDIIVRAKLDETWSNDGGDYKSNFAEAADIAEKTNAGDVYTVSQDNATDGETALDNSVVTKAIATDDDDTTGKWVDGGDGWYYWSVNLAADETTDTWLESVTLVGDADMGVYDVTVMLYDDEDKSYLCEVTYDCVPAYFTVDDNDEVTAVYAVDAEDVPDDAKTVTASSSANALTDKTGYAGSDYVLTVTIETVQATESAVEAMFGSSVEPNEFVTWTLVADDDADTEA